MHIQQRTGCFLTQVPHCDLLRRLQVERLQRKFTTIHSTLAQQTSGTPKVDSEPSLRASQAATEPEQPPKVCVLDDVVGSQPQHLRSSLTAITTHKFAAIHWAAETGRSQRLCC